MKGKFWVTKSLARANQLKPASLAPNRPDVAQGVAKTKKSNTYHQKTKSLKKASKHTIQFMYCQYNFINLGTRCPCMTYVNDMGQIGGVRALERCECGAFGALRFF